MSWSQIVVVGWLQFVLASFGIFWLATYMLRRIAQPVDRIRIIQCTLAATTLLPLLIAAAPWHAWRLEIVSPVEEVTAAVPPADVAIPESTEPPPVSEKFAPTAFDERPIIARSEVAETVIVEQKSTVPVTPQNLESDVPWTQVLARRVWMGAAVLILVLHGAALICFLGLRCVGRFQLHRLLRLATPASEVLIQSWDRLTHQRGHKVRLLVSSSLEVPVMYGWRRPIVLVPQRLANTGGPALSYCLAHEWAHIERHDFLAWCAADVCQILFWLQPAYWALRKELRLCQDLLADDRSTPAAGDAIEYSALLIDFARKRMVTPVVGALTFIDQPSQLSRRVKMLLEQSFLMRTRCTWKFSLAAFMGAGLLVLAISGIRIDATRAGEKVADKIESSSATNARSENPAKPAEAVNEPSIELKYRCIVVDKETGKGIANANVIVRRFERNMGIDRPIEESKHVTDSDGKYEIVIPADQVAISGLFIELLVDHENYAGRSGYHDHLRTMLKNEKLGDRPFFERVELYPGAAVTGTVVSPNGLPLAGVHVYGFSMVQSSNAYRYTHARTTSNADGSFRVVFHKDGDAGLWIIPKDFAVVKKILAGQRGDLGQIQFATGVRLSGQVLNVDRAPVAGVPVNIEYADTEDLGTLPASSTAFRQALTDPEGRFTLDPLPPGNYRVTIDDHFENMYSMDRSRFNVPAIFIPKKIRLHAGSEFQPVEIQAMPHVVINVQNFNSSGEKSRGGVAHINGTFDGEFWTATAQPKQDGSIALKVPHGLSVGEIQFGINERDAIRFRLGKGQPLHDGSSFNELGTLNDDIECIEVYRYRAPIVLVSAVGSDGKTIAKPQIKAKYTKPRPNTYVSFSNGSDIYFDPQTDGKFRTRWMLPDEDLTFSITAEGYESVEEKINLKEGETKELTVVLKNVDESKDAKTSQVEPAKELPAALKYVCSVIDKETGNGIPNARVVVRRSILTAIENRILEESKHTTDAKGKYVVNIPSDQVAEGALYIQLDVEHDDYASRMGHGYALSMIRKNEKLGERPFFEQTMLSPAESVFGTVVSSNGSPMAAVKVQGFTMVNSTEFRTTSFFDCLTGEDGKFRLNYEKEAEGVLWVIPKDHAPMEMFLGRKRGDLGELKLATGIRVTGRVLGIDLQPIVGVPVNIDYSGEREVTLPVATSVRRGVLSDSEGRFAFDPLPTGKYRLTVDDYLQDPLLKDRTRYSVPAIFQARTVELKAIGEPAFQELQAVPHVVISAQNLNSKREKIRGFQFDLFGRIDGESWFGSGRPNEHGTIVLKVPHGLQRAQLNLVTNEHGALRFRLGPGEPLRDDVHMVQLGTLNDDIEGVEVIQYKAPIVLVSAIDKDGQPIKQLQIQAKYAKPRPSAYVSFANKSDVAFERQNDGKYRTKQMLPDEDLTFSIAADGYEPIEKQINLKEGETNELVVTLKKLDESTQGKTSSIAPANDSFAPTTYVCSVVDTETGKGIAGAVVSIKQATLSASGERSVRESKHSTDTSGNYALEIPAELSADPTLRFEFRVEHENYAGTRREYPALTISKQLNLHPKFERIELVSGQAVTGVLVSPSGQPQPNVTMQSFWISPPPRNAYSSSFHFTRTDSQGKFRIVVPNGAETVLWALPDDFAIVEMLVPKERGDLGVIRLAPGVRVSGLVMGVNGQPLPNTLINIEYIGERNIGEIPVSSSVSRGTFSDANGRFSFKPLPSGSYRIEPGEYLQEHALQDFSHHPLQGVFRGQTLTLKEGIDPGTQQIQALPHIVFKAKFVDSAGQPTSGHQIAISGQLDSDNWQSNSTSVPQGEVTMHLPHGLRAAKIRLINNDLRAERYRIARGKPLVNFPLEFDDIAIGTLNGDLDEFEIVRYQAPTVFVSAVDRNQKPIAGFRVHAKLPDGQQPIMLEGGLRSAVTFSHEADGRFRSVRMLPDEDYTFTVSANGFEPIDSQVNLKEGATKDLIVTMKPADGTTTSLSK